MTTTQRKARSDKGVKRGPRKPKTAPTQSEQPAAPPPAEPVASPVSVAPVVEPQVAPAVDPPIELVDSHSRFRLVEGKTYGVGFAFCKRDGHKFTCVGPISTCKDYLNEVVFTENTKTQSSAYGYQAQYTGCFEDKVAHLVICVMGSKNATYDYSKGMYVCKDPANPEIKHANFDREFEYLRDNYKLLEGLMNQAEDFLKVGSHTKIQPIPGTTRYIVTLPIWWTQYTYLISLYALLIRIGVESMYKSGNIVDVLTKCRTEDSLYAATAKQKMDKMAAGNIYKQVFDLTRPNSHHCMGIQWAPI